MYHVISNPVSGRGKSNSTSGLIKRYLDEHQIKYKWYATEFKGHPKEVATDIDIANPQGGTIIIIGGDGTYNEVINGLGDLNKWKIGLIPAGSGNDLATKLNLKVKDPIYNLEIILNKEAKPIDYIQINQYRCLNIGGSGIDVDILQRFEKYKHLRGKFRYLCALFVTLIVFKWYDFKISIDGQPFENKTGFITAICNGSQYGGGIKICPISKVNDGKLNYVFINKIKRYKIIFYLSKLLKGKILKYTKFVECKPCEKIIFSSEKDFLFNIDGEIIKDNQFVCNIVKNGIKIFY